MNKKHVIGFRHTGIITNDIDKSLRFYRDILGLEVIQDFYDVLKANFHQFFLFDYLKDFSTNISPIRVGGSDQR